MADQVMKASLELDALVPEFWSAAFYDTLLAMLPFLDSVAKDYQGEIAGLGDTVNISVFPEFGLASELDEDAKNDADAVTVSKVQLVINKQIVKDFILTGKALLQGLDAQLKLRNLAYHSMARKMQRVIMDAVVPSASAPDHTIAYTSATTLALADMLAAKELLDAQDVSQAGRVMVNGVAQHNDLFNVTGFMSRDFIPNANAISSGAIQTPVLGFECKWTSEISDNKSYLFHPSFLQLAIQQAPAIGIYDMGVEGKRATRYNMTAHMGVKQVDDKRVVTIA